MAREWTEEQKQAARDRLAAARAKKQAIIEAKQKAQKSNEVVAPQNAINGDSIRELANELKDAPAPQEHSAVDPTVAELMRQVQELKDAMASQAKANPQTDLIEALKALSGNGNGAQVSGGRIVGTQEKHSTNLDLYDDPRPRLMQEPRLKRIAFDQNYELGFNVGVTQYETKDGLNMKEPKFHLQLIQIVLDDNGEPTNQRIGKAQMIFFEDPATAIEVANRMGLPVDEENQTAFLNEMRYYRVRDWLFECFWPPKTDANTNNLREMVINGQVVQTWEVNSENSAKIPFDKLENKLR